MGNNLVVFNSIPALKPIRRLHADERFPTHTKIHFTNGRGKALRPPPLHHVLRVCPRLPNQLAWGIKNSCDNHPLCLIHRVFYAPRELVWKAWTDPKYVMQW